MSSSSSSSLSSPWPRRIGLGLSALSILFCAFDAAAKIAKAQPVLDSLPSLGMPVSTVVPLGVVLLLSTAIYALPKTSPLGAVVLTGYLGGAIAMHVRVEAPAFNIVFALVLAGMIWGGLFLREPRLRQLLPLRT
jgi:hypothetical protein